MRKKIIIFNVAASVGGALTILKQYYDEAIKDKDCDYVFVVSTPMLEEADNVKILNYKWVKKSWVHRLYFDKVIANKIIKTEKPNEILSLQNIYVNNNNNIYQTIYVHQPLPFIDIKMSLFKDPKMWVYQNIIGRMIKKSINIANKIIVQTNWMKEAVLKKTEIKESNLEVTSPTLKLPKGYIYDQHNNNNIFFYPASALKYKNHKIVVDAAKILIDQGINNFKIEFTLTGNENKYISKLKRVCIKNNLPIAFIGALPYKKVIEKYSKSTLIFPSYIETFGLPLLEARTVGSPIIASNTPFSREICKGYNNIKYFDYTNAEELSKLIKEKLKL